MSASGPPVWHVDLEGSFAESEDARVEFERVDGGVRVYLVRPKRSGVDECWAAATAADAQTAIEQAAIRPEET